MQKKYIALLLLAFHCTLSYSQNLTVSHSISNNEYYEFKGSIDSLYPITMYLKDCGICGTDYHFRNFQLLGWYSYDSKGKKIPLVGYMNPSDRFEYQKELEEYKNYHRIELFVPPNYDKDTLSYKCKLDSFSERFVQNDGYDFSALKWISGKRELPVYLTKTHPYELERNAVIIIEYQGLPIHELSLNEVFGLNYISSIDYQELKMIEEEIHITLSFFEFTNPGGFGTGQCGAGIELYVAYLKLNKDWDILDQDLKLIESCANESKVEKFKIVEGNPELGLVKD